MFSWNGQLNLSNFKIDIEIVRFSKTHQTLNKYRMFSIKSVKLISKANFGIPNYRHQLIQFQSNFKLKTKYLNTQQDVLRSNVNGGMFNTDLPKTLQTNGNEFLFMFTDPLC